MVHNKSLRKTVYILEADADEGSGTEQSYRASKVTFSTIFHTTVRVRKTNLDLVLNEPHLRRLQKCAATAELSRSA